MKSHEELVSPISDYFIYSPSKQALDMFLYPMQCGSFSYLPGYSLSRDSFDSFLLMYVQKGELSLTFEGNTRIATAKYLLKNSRLSVKDICFTTGLSCESVFCSAFKRHQGMTPAQYRALEQP